MRPGTARPLARTDLGEVLRPLGLEIAALASSCVGRRRSLAELYGVVLCLAAYAADVGATSP